MGGKTSTTWPKGQKPPVKKPKGAINRKTKVARALGLENWSQLEEWAENDGIKECIKKMKRLRGASYVTAYTKLLEYIKPKLSRVEYEDKGDKETIFDFDQLPLELKEQIIEHLRNAGAPKTNTEQSG